MKLWQKDEQPNKKIEAFTVGNDYLLDLRLVKYDCRASMAHVRMLGKAGILTKAEVKALCDELAQIIQLSEQGKFAILPEQEDCHTAIENHLTEKLGEVGKKIHTARSRNDQVLTALRLYYKAEIADSVQLIGDFVVAARAFASKSGRTQFPGYTHTRKAMPTTIKTWAGAFTDAMSDNQRLLKAATELIDQSPLGTGAGYGVPLKIDRQATAQELGFKRVQGNPIYTQHSRGKFESSLLHVLTQIMYDLNRAATDLILFSLPQLGYIELPPDFCTGSSIMPQKQNPDVLELVRAKYHTVLACEMQLKTLGANLISGYHRDMQLMKEPTFTAIDVTKSCLDIMTLVFANMRVNAEKCKEGLTAEIFATAEAYELVSQGVPFREAYQQIALKYRVK